jgi:putative acetyltransferase
MAVIRRAAPEDAEAIGAIHMRAIREISVTHYSPELIDAWATPRHPDFYLESIRHKEFYVATVERVVVGFGILNQESGEIEAVYVSPDVVRRGIGLEILRALEERGRLLKVVDLYLKASLNAVAFYERGGFRQGESATHRLQSGVEIPCIVMEKKLPMEGN